ncbi:MAG: hypothetical protein WKF84_06900 [Pyrinomonadaceae bacterium]
MAEGHITDPKGMTKIRIYLHCSDYGRQHSLSNCGEHGSNVHIRDEGSKIVMKGCCRAIIIDQLDQINKTIDWLDFYYSINVSE